MSSGKRPRFSIGDGDGPEPPLLRLLRLVLILLGLLGVLWGAREFMGRLGLS